MHSLDPRESAVLEHLSDAVLIFDEDARTTWVGPSSGALGLDTVNVGHSAFEIVHPEDAERVRRAFSTARAQRAQPITVSAVRLAAHPDSTMRFDQILKYLPEAPGIGGMLAILRPRPDRAAREDVDESGADRALSGDSEQGAVFTADASERFQYVNRAAASALGAEPGRIVGQPVADFFPASLLKHYRADIQQVMRTGEDLIVEDRSQIKGRDVWLSTIVQPVRDDRGRVTAARLIARDVTTLKRAEQALRENEERLRQVVRLSGIGIFDHDHLSGEIYWSPEQREIYGWGPEEPVLFSRSGSSQAETWGLIDPQDRARVAAAVQRAHQSSDGQFEIEYRIIRRDGTQRWVSTRSQTFFAGEGSARRPIRTIGAVQDITERKRAERELRLTQTSVDRSNTAIFWLSAAGRVTYVNDRACQSLGRTRAELLELHVWDFDPGFTPERWAATANAFRREHSLASLTHHRRKDGTVFPVEVSGDYLLFDGEERIFVFALDISERQRAERELQLLSAAINSSRTPFFSSAPSGEIVYANEEACRSLGVAHAELIHSHVWDFDPNVTRESYRELWQGLKAKGKAIRQTQHRRKDGTLIPVEITANYFSLKGEEYSLTSAQDITERNRTELALRQSQERLQQVMQVYDIGIFEHEHRTDTLYWSPELRRAWNLDNDQAALVSVFRDAIDAEDRARVDAAVRKAYDPSGDGRFEAQMRVRRGDGVQRWMDARSQTFFEGQGAARRPVRTVGAMVDVTERRMVDEALRASERRLREAQSIAHIGSFELDLQTLHLMCSDEVYRLLEIEPSRFAATQDAFREVVHPQDRARVEAAYARSLTDGRPYQIIHRIVTHEGRIKHVEERCELEFASDGRPRLWRGTMQDVTARVVAEAALRDSLHEKETLLREVHHRVKNNLQIIASLLHFQAKRVRDPADLAAFAEGRDRLRAMILVHEKLYQSPDLSSIDFGGYLRALVRDLQHSHSAGARAFEVQVSADAVGLPIQLAIPCGMILCELLTNVFKYAYPEGKTGLTSVSFKSVGARVELCVSDAGVGLPPTFDPEHSSSFGWRLVRSLAAQLGGELAVERRAGTRVTIAFTNEARQA